MVRGKREKIQNRHRGIRGLKARMGRKCSISRGGRLNSGGIQVGGVDEEVTVLHEYVTVEITVEELTVLQAGTQHGGQLQE